MQDTEKTIPQYLVCDQTVAANGNSIPVALHGPIENATFFLRVIALTGTTPSLQMYVQHSPDYGTTWVDFIAFVAATAPGMQMAAWSRRSGGNAPGLTLPVGSGVINPGSVLNGPIVHQMVRIFWRLTGTSPVAEFSVYTLTAS